MNIHLFIRQFDLSQLVVLSTPRQSVTHAHWILESPRKTTCRNDAVCWIFGTSVMQSIPQVPGWNYFTGALFRES